MRTQLSKKAAGFSVVASLFACLFVTTTTVANPSQTASPSATSSIKLASNTPVFARTTTVKSVDTPVLAPAKEAKPHDKKAVSRCWNRLMTMIREVRQTHQSKK